MLSLTEFQKLSKKHNMIPLYEEIIVDTQTPVSLYKKLSELNDYSFLLESATSGERLNVGRYSFIGISPEKIIKNTEDGVLVTDSSGNILKEITEKSLNEYLKDYLNEINVLELEDLPPFSGGLVGYFGYEMVDSWEELFHNQKHKQLQKSDLPSSLLVISKMVVVYDHLTKTIKIIDNIFLEDKLTSEGIAEKYFQSKNRIKSIINTIRKPGPVLNNLVHNQKNNSKTISSNTEQETFTDMVKQAKDYIKEGEVFQLVLSQKFTLETSQKPFQIYRALRVSNPSPYMFYLNFPEVKLIGSSPEILVQVNDQKVITRPLAGTRKRGNTRKEDARLEADLKQDEKEKAEHIMLVDLGRNDLGKVCKYDTVETTELLGIEYYSRVMHLVSQVEGINKENISSLEVLKSVFPAGTVSGAPKIRAMELIDELEPEPRGTYAGAVGYIDFRGNLDTCITIRTFSYRDGKLTLQVGAGMVADSIPKKEYQETLNKARALFEALEITGEEVHHDSGY